jgi:pSer/pThr/pTyr-binding forkhead associated (FHA) protein
VLVRVVIDHIAGTRRGQRQELPAPGPSGENGGGRVRFGRHPDCEVAFDPHRDIDASSRHAELRNVASGWVLVDLGSSNGTYVGGHRVTEAPVACNVPFDLEFGPGGPRVRLFVGDDDAIGRLAPPTLATTRPIWLVPAITGAVLVVLLIVLLTRC